MQKPLPQLRPRLTLCQLLYPAVLPVDVLLQLLLQRLQAAASAGARARRRTGCTALPVGRPANDTRRDAGSQAGAAQAEDAASSARITAKTPGCCDQVHLAVLAPGLGRGAAKDELPPLAAELPPAAAAADSRRPPELCCMAASLHVRALHHRARCRGPGAGDGGRREEGN